MGVIRKELIQLVVYSAINQGIWNMFVFTAQNYSNGTKGNRNRKQQNVMTARIFDI